MLDLHHKLSEGDDESAKGSISQLRATLDAVSHMCQRIYEPMIERHEKSSQIHAALTLLNRHNEALSLPSKVGRRPINHVHSSCACAASFATAAMGHVHVVLVRSNMPLNLNQPNTVVLSSNAAPADQDCPGSRVV
jgi:hypothetical protein